MEKKKWGEKKNQEEEPGAVEGGHAWAQRGGGAGRAGSGGSTRGRWRHGEVRPEEDGEKLKQTTGTQDNEASGQGSLMSSVSHAREASRETI